MALTETQRSGIIKDLTDGKYTVNEIANKWQTNRMSIYRVKKNMLQLLQMLQN